MTWGLFWLKLEPEKETKMFSVEKNVRMSPRHKNSKYPFAEMDIGDSILVPAGVEGGTIRVGVAARSYAAYSGKKFSRKTLQNGDMRIWRVS